MILCAQAHIPSVKISRDYRHNFHWTENFAGITTKFSAANRQIIFDKPRKNGIFAFEIRK
jgi:hypothetical protein